MNPRARAQTIAVAVALGILLWVLLDMIGAHR